MKTIYVTIGNTDDKLTQAEWSRFVGDVGTEIADLSQQIQFHGFPPGDAPWQNACWALDIHPVHADELRDHLAELAAKYRQESIAWAEATVEFIAAT